MVRLLIILMVLAGVSYAGPLLSSDWKTEAPKETFIFNENGTLTIKGNSSGKELFYNLEGKTANPMQNGSGLSITLQFNTAEFLKDAKTDIYIAFHPENKEANGDDYLHKVTVQNYDNKLNIYDNFNNHDVSYDLSTPEDEITKVTINYRIKDNKLCFCYSISNGIVSEEITTIEVPDSQLDWRPSFGLSDTETNEFLVTDITFIPVPEPSVATLSLLTLAGLAARRRRG